MSDRMAQKNHLEEILNRVSSNVSSSTARSLWEKMRDEIRSGGPEAAARYVSAELDRCEEDFNRELALLRETHPMGG